MRFQVLSLCLALSVSAAHAVDRVASAERKAEIAYASPAAALTALRGKPGVSIREENDWFVINDPSEDAIWSIAQPAHPAHPTAVKRTLVQDDSGVRLVMRVQCGAAKEICDRVVQQFQQANENLKKKR